MNDQLRLRLNDESRDTAGHHGEPWSVEDLEFLHEFWSEAQGRVEAEREVAEALGRTIEACRQRHYEWLWGKGACGVNTGPHRHVVRRTTTTTTTTTEYIGLMDDPSDRWWSPDYYTNKEG